MDWFDGLQAHWVWLTLGLVLAGLEMLAPGVYLIWLALAAIVIGVMTLALDLSLAAQAYANQAMALLQEAVKLGFHDLEALKKTPDLEPLRSRADFGKLLRELETKRKPGDK